MSDERRYDEEEVAEIFRHATRETRRPEVGPGTGDEGSASSPGLTLAELQDIGEEVGIGRDIVARSAAALDVGPGRVQVTRRALGVPLAVSRTTPLPRSLTDEEWSRLVLDLRETFDARGKIREEAGFREWVNGNLHAMLEPTPGGERLRIRTRRSGGEVPILGGAGMIVFAVLIAVVTFATGTPLAEVLRETGILTILGGLGVGVGTVGLKRWSDERRAQIDAVSERVALMASRPLEGDDA